MTATIEDYTQQVAVDLLTYARGEMTPESIIKEYGLKVGLGESVTEALLMAYASHVTAAEKEERNGTVVSGSDRDCGVIDSSLAATYCAELKEERDDAIDIKAEQMRIAEQWAERAGKAESLVASLTKERDAQALQLNELRKYFDKAVKQEEEFREKLAWLAQQKNEAYKVPELAARVEELEKELREKGLSHE